MKEIEKFFDKVPIDKVYEDLFQPGLKKAGEALATVLDISNTILLPLKLINEKSKLIFIDNMKRYQQKLDKINEKNLTQVPDYVGLPILDRLTYLTEYNISEAFINILAQASNDETLKHVHPSFINVLNDLSSDEAKILFDLNDQIEIPFIDIYIIKEIEEIKKPSFGPKQIITKSELQQEIAYSLQDRKTTPIRMAWNLTGLEKKTNLNFPENIDLYLYNLEKHNIIEFDRDRYLSSFNSQYEELKKMYKDEIERITNIIEELKSDPQNKYLLELQIRYCKLEFTEYGKIFLKVCNNKLK